MCVSLFQHPLMVRRGHASVVLARLHHKSLKPHYRTAPNSTTLNYTVCAYRSPPLTPASCDGHYYTSTITTTTLIWHWLVLSKTTAQTGTSLRTRPPLLVLQVLPVWQTGGVDKHEGETVWGSMERRLPSGSRPEDPRWVRQLLSPGPYSQSQSQRRRAPGPWGGHFQGQVRSSSALPLLLLQYSTVQYSYHTSKHHSGDVSLLQKHRPQPLHPTPKK